MSQMAEQTNAGLSIGRQTPNTGHNVTKRKAVILMGRHLVIHYKSKRIRRGTQRSSVVLRAGKTVLLCSSEEACDRTIFSERRAFKPRPDRLVGGSRRGYKFTTTSHPAVPHGFGCCTRPGLAYVINTLWSTHGHSKKTTLSQRPPRIWRCSGNGGRVRFLCRFGPPNDTSLDWCSSASIEVHHHDEG